MRSHSRVLVIVVALGISIASLGGLAAQARATPPAAEVVSIVPPAALEALLPAAAGWTKSFATKERTVLSATCSYTFASAVFTNNGMRVRLTIADSGSNEAALNTLATTVMVFPAEYVGVVPPSTTVRRVVFAGAPAGEVWDSIKGDGEFTVVVDGRYVVKAEGTTLTDVATARRFVEMVDFAKLRAVSAGPR